MLHLYAGAFHRSQFVWYLHKIHMYDKCQSEVTTCIGIPGVVFTCVTLQLLPILGQLLRNACATTFKGSTEKVAIQLQMVAHQRKGIRKGLLGVFMIDNKNLPSCNSLCIHCCCPIPPWVGEYDHYLCKDEEETVFNQIKIMPGSKPWQKCSEMGKQSMNIHLNEL